MMVVPSEFSIWFHLLCITSVLVEDRKTFHLQQTHRNRTQGEFETHPNSDTRKKSSQKGCFLILELQGFLCISAYGAKFMSMFPD
jgi:hypothetical protein